MAEADYDAMLADQQAYADAVAQNMFEMALNMGYSYPQAVAEGQGALEAAEHEYSLALLQQMQFTPQVQAAMQAAEQAKAKSVESEQDKLLAEFQEERKAAKKARAMAEIEQEKKEIAAKLAEEKRAAKVAAQKRAAKLAEQKRAAEEKRAEQKRAKKLAEQKRAAEEKLAEQKRAAEEKRAEQKR